MPAFFFNKKIYENKWNNRPSAVGNNGMILYISDIGVGGSYWLSNGTTWRAFTGKYLLDSINAPIVSGTGTSYAVLKTVTIPANLIKDGDKLVIETSVSKSGAVDTCSVNLSIGTLATSSDPAFAASNQPAGANLLSRHSNCINFYSSPAFISTSRNPSGWGTTTSTQLSGSFDKTIVNYLSLSVKFTTGGIETATIQEFDVFHITGGV